MTWGKDGNSLCDRVDDERASLNYHDGVCINIGGRLSLSA
jgi:hypothetical protein